MRCIHCTNYVNFPEKMEGVTRVTCPYCCENFCLRCKKAWHGGDGCTVDTMDETLEAWKHMSGAQKCPTCQKLIEKDDPSTCNHMVHKITDGIPCTRDRTDFCCTFSLRCKPYFSMRSVFDYFICLLVFTLHRFT
jgi:hypothetical protein